MPTSTTAPMLGSRTPNHGFFWFSGHRGYTAPRAWATPELRAAKLAERIDLDHMVASYFDDVAIEAAEAKAKAEIEAMYEAEAAEVDYLGCGPYCDLCSAESNVGTIDPIGALFDDGDDDGVDAVELVAHLLGDVLDPTPSPMGDTFDPDDVQWGFTVRTRF